MKLLLRHLLRQLQAETVLTQRSHTSSNTVLAYTAAAAASH